MTASPEQSQAETLTPGVGWMPREPYLAADTPRRDALIGRISAGIEILSPESLERIAQVVDREVNKRPHGAKSLRSQA
jgi:hypothetical protein